MGHQGAAHLRPRALHHVDDPCRKARLEAEGGQRGERQRRVLRGLDHHRAACRQGRAELPGADHQGRIPRHDQHGNADGFAHGVVEGRAPHEAGRGDLPAFQLVGPPGEIAQGVHRHGDVEHAHLHDGAPLLPGQQLGEVVGPGLQQVGQAVDQARPRRAGQGRPGAPVKLAAGGAHGGIHIGGGAGGHPGQQGPGGRLELVEPGIAATRTVFTCDQVQAVCVHVHNGLRAQLKAWM